ncbi:MFS transporter [Nocardioides hungaricus]
MAACVAVFIAQIANATPAPLNGLFQADLQTSGTQLTWITAVFQLGVLVFEFTFGVLGDMFGRRRLVIAGALTLVVGSVVSALAPSVEVLWVGAAINGLGAGAIYPGTLALVAAVSHTPEARARSIALWSGCIGGASVVGPAFGAMFAQAGDWRAPFWVLGGLAVVAAVVTKLMAQESSAPEGRGLDAKGQVTFAAGMLLVMFGAIQGAEAGWSKPEIVWSFVVGGALLLAFVTVEARAKTPILDLGLFKNRAFAVTSLVTVTGMLGFVCAVFSTALWIANVQQQDPMKVVLVQVFVAGPAFVLIPLISRVLRIANPMIMLAGGYTLMGIGALLYLRLDPFDVSMAHFIAPALLLGLGFGAAQASFTAVAINAVPLHLAGMASATTNMLRDLGFVLGTVVASAVALSRAGGDTIAGLRPLAAELPADEAAQLMGLASEGGPLAVVAVLPAGSPAHDVAVAALGNGFHVAWLVAGVVCLASAAITVIGLRGVGHIEVPSPEALTDPLHPED